MGVHNWCYWHCKVVLSFSVLCDNEKRLPRGLFIAATRRLSLWKLFR